MKKWWVEPGFVACQTSRFNGSVNYNIKMTTLHERVTINKQINGRKNMRQRNKRIIAIKRLKIFLYARRAPLSTQNYAQM